MLYVHSCAEALIARACLWEPVEVAFGSQSVMGELDLDHHGKHSHRPPVSVVAAELALKPDFKPRRYYCVTGLPDPDAIYTILVLSGQIKPDMAIAKAIGELDVEPVGIDRKAYEYLRVAAFDFLFCDVADKYSEAGYNRALDIGKLVFSPGPLDAELVCQVLEAEQQRQAKFLACIKESIGQTIAFVVSDDPGRDIWHQTANIVVQYKPGCKRLTISGLSEAAKQRISEVRQDLASVHDYFGPTGLLTIFPRFDSITNSKGGGRPDIGGWGRGEDISHEQAYAVYQGIQALLTATPHTPDLSDWSPDPSSAH